MVAVPSGGDDLGVGLDAGWYGHDHESDDECPLARGRVDDVVHHRPAQSGGLFGRHGQ
jgi:hypothetical protein